MLLKEITRACISIDEQVCYGVVLFISKAVVFTCSVFLVCNVYSYHLEKADNVWRQQFSVLFF